MNLLAALKQECRISAKDAYSGFLTKDEYAVNSGAWTQHVARRMSSEHYTYSVEKCRYHLKKLKKQGIVISKPNPGGNTQWWPVGFIDEMKAN